MDLIKKIKLRFFWLPSILMIADAVSKLLFPDFWIEHNHLNFQNRIIWIGIIELCCALIYIFPVTMSIGFFLICCYWGTALGISINNEQFNIFSLLILIFFSLSFYWRGVPVFFKDMFGRKN
jgi:hypothetical protein